MLKDLCLTLKSDIQCNHCKDSCSLNIIILICNIDFSPVYNATALLIRVQKLIALTALFISQTLQYTTYFNLVLKLVFVNSLVRFVDLPTALFLKKILPVTSTMYKESVLTLQDAMHMLYYSMYLFSQEASFKSFYMIRKVFFLALLNYY